MIEVRQDMEVTIVTLDKRHTVLEPSTGYVRRVLHRLTVSGPILLLDFSATKRIDADFLGTLLRMRAHLRQQGGRMALCGVGPAIAEIIQVCGLGACWECFPSRGEALGRLFAGSMGGDPVIW